MKLYCSPLRLLENKDNPIFAYEKRRVLSKLEDSPHNAIAIDHCIFNEAEIRDAFRSLENETEFVYHKMIFHNQNLLNFLECRPGNHENLNMELKWSKMGSEFNLFVLPYFQYSLTYFINQGYFKRNPDGIATLKQVDRYVPEALLPDVYGKIEKSIESDLDKLKRLVSMGKHTQLQHVSEFLVPEKLLCIEALPAYFDARKKAYFGLLVQIGNANLERKNYALALSILKKLEIIEVPDDLKSLYEKNLKFLKLNARRKPDTFTNAPKNSTRVAVISVSIALVIVVTIVLSSKSSSKKTEAKAPQLFSIADMVTALKPYYIKQKNSNLAKYYYAERYKALIAQEPPENIRVRHKKRSSPYRRVLTHSEFEACTIPSQLREQHVEIRNGSTFDAILFFVKNTSEIAGHTYVYAGDVKYLNFTPFENPQAISDYDVYAYVGTGWNDFFRFRAGAQGFNGMFEYQPLCYKGIQHTQIKLSFAQANTTPHSIALGNGSEDCPVNFSYNEKPDF